MTKWVPASATCRYLSSFIPAPLTAEKANTVIWGGKGNGTTFGKIEKVPSSRYNLCSGLVRNLKFSIYDKLHLMIGIRIC